MATYGTHHFYSLLDAEQYYCRQGYRATDVAEKILAGEIAIGRPATKPGQRIELSIEEGRYFIVESAK